MEKRHAILSPSAAYRWLACTPSARFEEQLPEEESTYAAEGTLAHELAALLLDKTRKVKFDTAKLDEIKANDLYSAEMLEHCQDYVNFVLDLSKGAFVHVEREYDMSAYIPLQFGTCDASFVKNGTIYVVDLKYGAGVRVSATANKQMMCYALGAYDCHRKGQTLKNVCLSIFQPRAGGSSSWELPVTDLLEWAKTEATPKGKLAIAGAGDFVPGKHCQFCKARTLCKAYYDRFAEIMDIHSKLHDGRMLANGDIATVLTYGPLISKWVKDVEASATGLLEKGGIVPGFKLVAGRGKRSFRNEDDVVDILLGEGYESYQIFDPKLNSLTAIEKMVGGKRFKELFADSIVNIPGKAQIAPEDDERPAIGASAADEFDEDDLT